METIKDRLKFFMPTARAVEDIDVAVDYSILANAETTSLKNIYRMADEHLPEIMPEMQRELHKYIKGGQIRLGYATKIDMSAYPYTISVGRGEGTANAFVGLCHELTHSMTNSTCEVAPRVTDGVVEKYLKGKSVLKQGMYKLMVQNDFIKDNWRVIEMSAGRYPISDAPYYWASVASIPILEKIGSGEIEWWRTFEIRERNTIEKLKSLGVTSDVMKASAVKYLGAE